MKTTRGPASEMNASPRGLVSLATYNRTRGAMCMTISHPISRLSPPIEGGRVPDVTFSYFNSGNRRRAFTFLVREFDKSGLTRSELAVGAGKSKAQISRLLGRPTNLTTDTMGELLFAISGKTPKYRSYRPIQT